jgi:hypothetical protein
VRLAGAFKPMHEYQGPARGSGWLPVAEAE